MEKKDVNIGLWKRIALVAGAFAFVISILLIVNYAQYKRYDPVETQLINKLVNRLNSNPDDNQLRDEIRTVDLLARKAYFTNQWQVRTGGFLLLLSGIVLLLAMQIIRTNSPREVLVSERENTFFEQKVARKWVAVSGSIIVVIALVFAFLTHQEMSILLSGMGNSTNTEVVKLSQADAGKQIVATVVPETIQSEVNLDADVAMDNRDEMVDDNKAIDPPHIENAPTVSTGKQIEKNEKGVEVEPPTTAPKKDPFPSISEINQNHPAFRGPNGNGISYCKNIPVNWDASSGENVEWKVKIPLPGYNSPIIWGDKVFVSGANSSQREVYCMDRNTGGFLWTAQVSGISGSPASAPNVTDDTGQAAPTLTTDGNRVFALFANGDLVALDMDGKQIWAKNMGSTGNHYGHASSLMLLNDILILQYDIKASPKIIGLSATTGETIWETSHKVKISWASPIVVNTGNMFEIITVADPMVSSHDPKTGTLNWELNCIFGEVGPSAAYADGVVYAVNDYARLVAIQLGESPEILWESDEYLSDVPSPVATKDLLFMATSYGVLVCYDAKTGEIVWEHEFDSGFYSSPMLAEGKIYLIDMAGIMHVMEAKNEFFSLGESPLGEKCMTTPAFADGKIYIRGNEHLFCVDNE